MNLVLDKIGFLINKENILLFSLGRNKKRRKERKGEGGRKEERKHIPQPPKQLRMKWKYDCAI